MEKQNNSIGRWGNITSISSFVGWASSGVAGWFGIKYFLVVAFFTVFAFLTWMKIKKNWRKTYLCFISYFSLTACIGLLILIISGKDIWYFPDRVMDLINVEQSKLAIFIKNKRIDADFKNLHFTGFQRGNKKQDDWCSKGDTGYTYQAAKIDFYRSSPPPWPGSITIDLKVKGPSDKNWEVIIPSPNVDSLGKGIPLESKGTPCPDPINNSTEIEGIKLNSVNQGFRLVVCGKCVKDNVIADFYKFLNLYGLIHENEDPKEE